LRVEGAEIFICPMGEVMPKVFFRCITVFMISYAINIYIYIQTTSINGINGKNRQEQLKTLTISNMNT
jgi:hypothetical protein